MSVNPLGDVLAGPCYEMSTILTADLDPGVIAQGKFDLDVVGHYALPDIFQLRVNTRANTAVSLGRLSEEEIE